MTGVQTCALPISDRQTQSPGLRKAASREPYFSVSCGEREMAFLGGPIRPAKGGRDLAPLGRTGLAKVSEGGRRVAVREANGSGSPHYAVAYAPAYQLLDGLRRRQGYGLERQFAGLHEGDRADDAL